MEPTKRCTKCSETLPLAEFYKDKSGGQGVRGYCKACERKRVAQRHATPQGAKARRKTLRRHEKTSKRRCSMRAYHLRRKDALALATPAWSPLFLIADVYREAERLSLESGIKHEVHHIMPIMEFGALFVGLHVPWNLEILTAEEHTHAHIDLRRTYSRASQTAKRRIKA